MLVLLVAAFTYVFLANAWLGDDAYITFRTIWNLIHGYGAVFNPGERVQAYTHPLWMLLLTTAHAVTREFFFTALAVSYACSLAAILIVLRHVRAISGVVVTFLWLISSKAFVDYTSSGLENPLAYLLLALFYVRFCELDDTPVATRSLGAFGVIAGLAFVNRLDSVVLYALPLAWLAFAARRRRQPLTPLLVGFLVPAGLWVAFATIYYGFPLPNTYYAKVATGIPGWLLHEQGVAYVLSSVNHDPLTLATIGAAAALSLAPGAGVRERLAAASTLLFIVYTISVGGDFMSGRFFAAPFLVAVIVMLRLLRGWTYDLPLAAALVVYNLIVPLVPIKTTGSYDGAWAWRSQNGIKDERGHYHQITNVFFFSPFRELPDHTWMREGLSFREGPEKVTVQGSIGFFGLAAGPDKRVIDRNALSDPLLARLPVSWRLYFEFYAGHYFRDIPDGYLESVASGDNRLTDPLLHDYYDRLKEAISGPLFSLPRLRSLWYLNLGEGRTLSRRYEARRPVVISERADNDRFLTDVGERDAVRGELRSTGRPGYLQLGPGIPMKAGVYRARWIGHVSGGDTVTPGFVDVWADGQRLARMELTPGGADADGRLIAEVPFVLAGAARHLDYRIWIDGATTAVLERVELFSGGPRP